MGFHRKQLIMQLENEVGISDGGRGREIFGSIHLFKKREEVPLQNPDYE
jgi:hypothetical protein